MSWIKIIELVTIFCSICTISGYLKNSIDDIVEDYSKCEELKKETDYYHRMGEEINEILEDVESDELECHF